jgi:exodeoxyribonuclease-1
MEQIRQSTPKALAELDQRYDDGRIPEMLFRYRARNFPQTLSPDERQQWDEYRKLKFNDPAAGIRTLNQVKSSIDELRAAPDTTGAQLVVLEELEKHLEQPDFINL